MGRYIEKLPPRATGNAQKDMQDAREYLFYLREQINLILSAIYRREEQSDGGQA